MSKTQHTITSLNNNNNGDGCWDGVLWRGEVGKKWEIQKWNHIEIDSLQQCVLFYNVYIILMKRTKKKYKLKNDKTCLKC